MEDQMTRKPTHHLWAVRKTQDGKGFWSRVGAAWQHADEDGMTLKFELLPVAGQDLVLRRAKNKERIDSATGEVLEDVPY
jgi:hypothetical protein